MGFETNSKSSAIRRCDWEKAPVELSIVEKKIPSGSRGASRKSALKIMIIKAKNKGTVKIYVYTQNGICKTIKVKVK